MLGVSIASLASTGLRALSLTILPPVVALGCIGGEPESTPPGHTRPTECGDDWTVIQLEGGGEVCGQYVVGDVDPECPTGFDGPVSNGWHVFICSRGTTQPDEELFSLIIDEFVKRCAKKPTEQCSSDHAEGCDYYPAEARAFWEGEMCEPASTGICLFLMGSLGNALDCLHRTLPDGRHERVLVSDIFIAPGWENGEASGIDDEHCTCMER